MSMNTIQFLRGLSLPRFQALYGSPAQCEQALIAACWPHGWHYAHIQFTPVTDFTNEQVQKWAKSHLAPSCHVVSDGTAAFAQVRQAGATHERHVTGGGRQGAQTPQLHWVNTLLGNLKTSLAGTYHAFKHSKYASRYLAEFAYRFNRRFDMPAMLPRRWSAPNLCLCARYGLLRLVANQAILMLKLRRMPVQAQYRWLTLRDRVSPANCTMETRATRITMTSNITRVS